ncbi:DUF7448 domain-containing protein [Bacillus subtilis]|uniref:DUF7448 domain-containing protein n=1 Tax=Bacillus subtilis TaxID=1423 RepID=UPI0025C7BBF2|nr:hypothetical protein [Bacillus subtilis]GLI90491.1 hypothetical protein ANABIO4_38430 [Bacillus subtilis]
MYGRHIVNVSELKGKTLVRIENSEDNELYFYTADGDTYKMYHEQDCCEDVHLEEIIGDLGDLVGEPILMAEEVTNCNRNDDCDWSETWTFYKLATVKGYVTLRWHGTSNGFYSEAIDFVMLPREESSDND